MIPDPFTIQVLHHRCGGEGPRVAEVYTQGRAATIGRGLVKVLLGNVSVAGREVRRNVSQGTACGQAITNITPLEGMRPFNVVDVATVVLVISHDTQRGALTHGDIHEALGPVAQIATFDLAGIQAVTA